MSYKAIVIGVSAGGLAALGKILPRLPADYQLPLIIVQHISPDADNYMISHFDSNTAIKVKEADEKELIKPGVAYFAPPNYHLLIETDFTFSLSVEERVNFSRPSIDVLFESAIDVWRPDLIGILLTGASSDGSKGLRMIKECGGLTIVQDPKEAEVPVMPEAAINLTKVDKVLKLDAIADFLASLNDLKHLQSNK